MLTIPFIMMFLVPILADIALYINAVTPSIFTNPFQGVSIYESTGIFLGLFNSVLNLERKFVNNSREQLHSVPDHEVLTHLQNAP